jgi:aryl-alcohol dehydrogenase-like predicted oxidoreductase
VVYDDGVTLQETWAAMESLVDAGLSLAIGLSDIDVEGTRQIIFCSEAGLASPFIRERDRAHNDSRVIWGPAEGRLSVE